MIGRSEEDDSVFDSKFMQCERRRLGVARERSFARVHIPIKGGEEARASIGEERPGDNIFS